MFKIGDYVTRNKYGNDILFKITDIKGDQIILSGVDLRLYADAKITDLTHSTYHKKKETVVINNLRTDEYFYVPGTILHLDSDKDYLKDCINYYKKNKINYYGYIFNEKDYSKNIVNLIKKHNPNIVIITGHDAYYDNNKYKNSNYFIDTVKEIRKINKDIIIFAGACQSDYIGLIKAGSTFSSSPKHINIHALDPAIIGVNIALTDKYESVNLEKIIEKTECKKEGIGGIKTKGTMICGYPRGEKTES